jgi:hypothetical protein
MAVERAFGILKGRWRILLKRIDMPLQHIPNVITACICLHNLCIIYRDEFDIEWAKEGEGLMQRESSEYIGQLHKPDIFLAAVQAAKEMRRYLKLDEGITPIEDIEETTVNEARNDRGEDEIEIVEAIESRVSHEARIQSLLVQATKAHELLADSFWEAHLLKEGKILFPTTESDCEEV